MGEVIHKGCAPVLGGSAMDAEVKSCGGTEYDREDGAVAESLQYMRDAISQWSTTALATILEVRDRRHHERISVAEAIKAIHMLSACQLANGEACC